MRTRLAALAAWKVEDIDAAFHATVETLELGMGKVAQPLRVAITGTQVSPDIAHTIYLAGREEALKRVAADIAKLPADKPLSYEAGEGLGGWRVNGRQSRTRNRTAKQPTPS